MTGRIERRTQSRQRPVSLVYVELPPSNGGMMRDLSERGFSVRAMMPLQMSEKVAFSFNLDSTARIDGEAIVVRLEDRGQVAALEFAGLSAHSRDQIRRYLERFDKPVATESVPVQAPVSENSTFEELRTEIRATERRPATPPVKLPVSMPEAPHPPEHRAASAEEPPPLLKLSSVRPEPVQAAPRRAIEPEEEPEAVEVEAYAVAPVMEEKPEPQSRVPAQVPQPVPAAPPSPPPVLAARAEPMPELPPALEPLSSFETESDVSLPAWMDRFTLTRAIGIMLLFTLVASLVVYHREFGHALVWLGQRIAGDETSESVPHASSPAAASTEASPASASDSTNPTPSNPVNSAAASNASAGDFSPAKGDNIPVAAETAPPPQLKDGTASALVPLTQVTRTPAASAPAAAPGDTGQAEYQKAHTILQTPGRRAELPEAVKLLWSAVEKGNVAAEITLAELYRAGRGVTRNCVQAKILLSTAARKGSADAQRRLEELQQEGCTE